MRSDDGVQAASRFPKQFAGRLPRVNRTISPAMKASRLLVFERSVDPKGVDQDLVFIYEPDGGIS
ncbi:MAG: hypothetical protein JOZ60_05080 [Verrucomicrobia bacterium]|nr:hypothetical protein [Verrucomicrobiota bacterium]